ncbi:MAG: cysteine dioxygenase family protein [Cyanobacteria bacterium P01_G01_bin.39]
MTPAVELASNKASVSRLPNSLQSLIALLSQTSYLTPQKVYQSLKLANISQAELMPWASFAHSISDSYGRQLVYDGGYFEIMVMSWQPGDVSAIHDHGQAQWGAVQCFGQGTHTVYSLEENTLHTLAETPLFPQQILRVNHDLIHQMSNYSSERFLSLHVYGCYEPKSTITGDARIFDLLEGRIQYTNGGVFFCLPEPEIERRGQAITADRPTIYRHHRQMRDRILKVLNSSNSNLAHWRSKLAQLEPELESYSRSHLRG